MSESIGRFSLSGNVFFLITIRHFNHAFILLSSTCFFLNFLFIWRPLFGSTVWPPLQTLSVFPIDIVLKLTSFSQICIRIVSFEFFPKLRSPSETIPFRNLIELRPYMVHCRVSHFPTDQIRFFTVPYSCALLTQTIWNFVEPIRRKTTIYLMKYLLSTRNLSAFPKVFTSLRWNLCTGSSCLKWGLFLRIIRSIFITKIYSFKSSRFSGKLTGLPP